MRGRVRLAAMAALLPVLLAACEPLPVDPEEVARDCERRARASEGPTGSVTIGASTGDGAFLGGEIGLTTDALRGRDPYEVYDSCVRRRTGAGPVRPPNLFR